MKRCYRCGEEKAPEAFYRNRRSRDGRAGQCKACYRERYAGRDHGDTAEATRRWQAAAWAKTRERAMNHGKAWTGPELEIATRPGLAATEAALILGRTVGAVYGVRTVRTPRA
jgi:hypothetical protein